MHTESTPDVKEVFPAKGENPGEKSNSLFPQPERPVVASRWIQFIPFFLSAVLFLSAFFAIFAPLPLVLLLMGRGRALAWLAVLTNGALVFAAGGVSSLLFYGVFVVALALPLGEMLKKKKSLEMSSVVAWVSMAICAAGFLALYSKLYDFHWIAEIQKQVSIFVEYVEKTMPSQSLALNPGDLEEWKSSLILEMPSGIAIFALVLIWANLILVFRANPGKLRESLKLDASYLKKWKAPEFLVWPTILSGAFLVIPAGTVSHVSLNVFKFLMAIYTIQGLSILSYFFDLWKVRGFFRFLGYFISLFLMMPVVLSLGFFDLWFDFRSKFRQS